MPAMIDARCDKCGRRFGWCGELKDRPACPRCGARPPQSELDAAQAKMDRMQHLMLSNATLALCLEQRVMAGLTLHQAAKLLDVPGSQLADIENGRAVLPEDLAKRMNEIYGVED